MKAATHFASPQLIAAARACASGLANVPRVSPMPENQNRIVKEPTPRESRLLQAAHYFISSHPEYTISQRLRFGRAHGFKHWEFRRAIGVTKKSRAAQIADRAAPCSDRGSGCGARDNTLRSERLECREDRGNAAADAGSCATTFTASRSEPHRSPASSRELRPCVSEPLGAAVQFSNNP